MNQWFARLAWFVIFVAVVALVLRYVPLVRHYPVCTGWPKEGQELAPGIERSFWFDAFTVEGSPSNYYTDIFTDILTDWDVPFVEIGGIVFFRAWDRFAVHSGDIHNADQRTIRYLANPEMAHPIWDEMPSKVRDRLLKIQREEIEAPHCEFVRTLVLRNWGRE